MLPIEILQRGIAQTLCSDVLPCNRLVHQNRPYLQENKKKHLHKWKRTQTERDPTWMHIIMCLLEELRREGWKGLS